MNTNGSVPNQKQSKSSWLINGIIIFFFVGILAAIAIPNFPRFSARETQSEAKQNLGAIYTAYTAYHSDYNTYPSAPFNTINGNTFNCLNVADWEPKGQIRYTYNCMNTAVFSPSVDGHPCPPEIVTRADKDSFTVAACGNIDNDATLDVWTINNAKQLINVINDKKM